ncbi:MAG: FAD-dependent oxidoreductase [Phycisphaerae bacterium]|nr:FAD-dependent oxidoreductase [Phycisphaerae bacterium]
MPIVVRNVLLGLNESEEALPGLAARRLHIPESAVRYWSIVRRAIDARKKDVRFSYQLEIALEGGRKSELACLKRMRPAEAAWIKPEPEEPLVMGKGPSANRPVIVGFGPGGMFAALRLAELGYRPLVLERGREVRRRHRDIMQRYYRERDFDPESNLLFGEGGAGTYSDGKLYTRLNDPLCRSVLETLYLHGADPDILVDTRPHLGSDRLPTLCTRIRERIESLGGEIRFGSRLDDIRIEDGRLIAVHVSSDDSARAAEWMDVGPVLLSIGHSARDTIRMLSGRGVRVESKPFQMGVRVEHPQEMVDRWQYGAAAGHVRLGAAEYHVVARGAARDYGDMFSFCMCPGGVILPTNESAGLIVTNGASRSHRSGRFANSGLVFTMNPAVAGMSALDAVAFQERWERLAFETTGRTYCVPAQRAADFLEGRISDGMLETSFPLGGQWTDIRAVVPKEVSAALERALPTLEAKFPGFAGADALVTAPETRASAPVRLVRDAETRQAEGVQGLYPVGEGAGYAGGILSAAVDGIKSAHAIVRTYAPHR